MTKIEWVINPDGTQGETINPLGWGCYGPGGDKGSPRPCHYCYAREMALRGRRDCPECKEFIPHWHPEQLLKPLKWKKPRTIFVQSMGDLFHPEIPEYQIKEVLKTVKKCTNHIFLFLTKNPAQISNHILPFNCWFGASADTANHAGTFTDNLLMVKHWCSKTFISAEPLLADIAVYIDYEAVGWIIIGCLNKNGRAVKPENGGTKREWIKNILERAEIYNTPVFIKKEIYSLYPDLPVKKALPFL